MNIERLKLVRDAVTNSGRETFDLSTYESCVMSYCAHLPQFNALGLNWDAARAGFLRITYGTGTALSRRTSSLEALLAFFETDDTLALNFTYCETYARAFALDVPDVPVKYILAKIDEIVEGHVPA
jgi:hypothetical protein